MLSLFISFLILTCFHLSSAIRADWKEYLDPEIYQKYAGKAAEQYTDTFFQGDIDRVDLDTSMDEFSEYAANAIKDARYRWPDNTVPFTISDTFNDKETKLIRKAMAAMTKVTDGCIKFKAHGKEEDYVKIARGLGCFSSVGRQGGAQIVSLTRGCLDDFGDVQHEIMHALGFYHEQSRMDRDKYILIDWDNIAESNKVQFQKFDGYTFGLPYDYSSVMHYVWNAFAANPGSPTIIGTQKRAKIGQKDNLSELDIKRIRMAYGCEPTGSAGAVEESKTQSVAKKSARPPRRRTRKPTQVIE